jgi:lipopolysaccharide transport system permease protein
MWPGDYPFLLSNLIQKDFKVRYRNMSLGVFWSLLNPLVMMTTLWFVFTKLFPSPTNPHYAASILCGLVPYNFFSMAWICGTTSVVDSAGLIKRMTLPREAVTLASVLSTSVHLAIQIVLLLLVVLLSSCKPGLSWLWLPYVWLMEIIFVCGLSFITAALNVYIRDIRYVVESTNLVLFWLVPIVYPFSYIKQEYREIYLYNPLSAMVLALRSILIDNVTPASSTLVKLSYSSIGMLVVGLLFFRHLKRGFYDYL